MEKIVTVASARRILGKRAKGLSDTQVSEFINTLQILGREQLGYNGSKDEENGKHTSDKLK